MIDSLDDKSGKEQLTHYFRAISTLGLNRPFLFVWDCDGESEARKLIEGSSLFKFVLPKNSSNQLATKGIENAFSEEQLKPHCTTTQRPNGQVIRKFDADHKRAFADKIVKSTKLEDFSGLEELKLKIEQILKSI